MRKESKIPNEIQKQKIVTHMMKKKEEEKRNIEKN